MKIALLTLGTRGDVQPYAVLGKVLSDRGHKVYLSTGENFKSLAEGYGLHFVPVEADFQALINSAEGKAMMKNPFTARKHFRHIVQPMMVEAMKVFYNLAKEMDCVLYHVKTLGDYFADQFPQKMIRANVIPAVLPTSAFPNPVFSGLSLPKFLNRFTYQLADLGLAMMNPAIREFRATVGLATDVLKKPLNLELYGISETFLPKPSDFPTDVFFTGFWNGESTESLDKDTLAFTSTEKKTIVVTFGSMPFNLDFDLNNVLSAIAKSMNLNILVVKGWGFKNSADNESNTVKYIDSAPFDSLFPKVDAVVHHGGIGTLAACLRAGVPSLSCPVIYPMGDQYFWGNHAYKIGCAVKPIPLKKLTVKALSDSITEMLTDETIRKNCDIISKKLALENGAKRAAEIVESHFSFQR